MPTYMQFSECGVENEKFFLVKIDSRSDRFQSGLVFEPRLRNIWQDLGNNLD